jgi:hypothetical protein
MWQKNKLTVIATAIILFLGLAMMWLVLPALPTVKLQKNDDAQWQVPSLQKEDPQLVVEQLLGRSLWKEPAASGSGTADDVPLTAPDWRIAAVIKVGNLNQLVISFNDKPNNLQTLTVGDKLPGGFPILRIEQNWIAVSVDGKKSMLPVGRN